MGSNGLGAAVAVDGERAEPALRGAERRGGEGSVPAQLAGHEGRGARVGPHVVDDDRDAAARDPGGGAARGEDQPDRARWTARSAPRARPRRSATRPRARAMTSPRSAPARSAARRTTSAQHRLRVVPGQRRRRDLGGRPERTGGEVGLHGRTHASAARRPATGPCRPPPVTSSPGDPWGCEWSFRTGFTRPCAISTIRSACSASSARCVTWMTVPGSSSDRAQHLLGGRHVQVRGRLVEQDDVGGRGREERPGEGEPLGLAAGGGRRAAGEPGRRAGRPSPAARLAAAPRASWRRWRTGRRGAGSRARWSRRAAAPAGTTRPSAGCARCRGRAREIPAGAREASTCRPRTGPRPRRACPAGRESDVAAGRVRRPATARPRHAVRCHPAPPPDRGRRPGRRAPGRWGAARGVRRRLQPDRRAPETHARRHRTTPRSAARAAGEVERCGPTRHGARRDLTDLHAADRPAALPKRTPATPPRHAPGLGGRGAAR